MFLEFLMDMCHMKVSLKPGALDEKLGRGQCFLNFFFLTLDDIHDDNNESTIIYEFLIVNSI